MSGKVKGQAAYVEEIDENGETVRRTAKKEDSKKERPSNERRSSRKEKEKSTHDSRHANTNSSSGSSPPVKRVELKQPSREERRMSSSSTKSPKKTSSRPPSAHKNATFPTTEVPMRTYVQPVLIQQPHVRTIAQHNTRPSSFHEGMLYNYAPPLSNSAYYGQPNSIMPAPSYPPPSPGGNFLTYGNGGTYHSGSGNNVPPAFRQDYFPTTSQVPARTLVERLGGTDSKARRRLSVYSTGDERGYESSQGGGLSRTSSLRKTKEELDAERIPPPPRRRASIRYPGVEPSDDERYLSRSLSRSRPIYNDEHSPPRRRPSIKRHSATYTYGSDARIEPERSGRRNSYYPPKTSSYPVYDVPPVNYEDKYQAAEKYQTSVGGPQYRLTAETLKKANRRAQPTSSHSTRSSGSHDESERQRSSVTTRTTGTTNKTGAGEEDITIKLKGQGKIKIAGAEIDYDKDTELNIRRGGNTGVGGSQRSSEYGTIEDRRDRRERASDRSRLSSNVRIPRERYYQSVAGNFF